MRMYGYKMCNSSNINSVQFSCSLNDSCLIQPKQEGLFQYYDLSVFVHSCNKPKTL